MAEKVKALKDLKAAKENGVFDSDEYLVLKQEILSSPAAVPQGQPVPVAPQQVQVGIPGQDNQALVQLEMMKVCWRSHE